ncbi:MAG: DUF1015 domain-containing protein [Desulfomonilia bacterium]|jgi:hypothetical protein
MKFDHIALEAPEILLPRKGIDLTKWAVVACDQYTSQPEYWEEVRRRVGEDPSTFHLILPEAYLKGCDPEEESRRIEEAMNRYLETGVLVSMGRGFILVERTMPGGAVRKGLVAALDLERYDYHQGSQSLIRATEGTVVDRLPPRTRIRRNAPLELPHIMVLIDDPEKTVIEPLFAGDREPVYDFELMQGGGHIRGWRIGSAEAVGSVARAIERLADPRAFREKYGVQSSEVLLYAMGDGNHSLATAKEIWEGIKASAPDAGEVMDHPARYALVELVNLHDTGLVFEPIHRVVFNAGADGLLKSMEDFFTAQGSAFSVQQQPDGRFEPYPAKEPGTHVFSFVSLEKSGIITLSQPALTLEAGSLQAFLDAYTAAHPEVAVDYIHGDDTLASLASRPQTVGFYLPAISKHELFRTIIVDGVLPRKTFSMGHAHEKRFYLECRKITR